MQLDIFQVDAFTDKIFGGNPAAVCPLDFWLEDSLLQSIALENNLSETAFFYPDGDDFQLRWFTPGLEVNLCGHATLATAHVLFTELNYNRPSIIFNTRSGALKVENLAEGKYLMDFPSDHAVKVEDHDLIKNIEVALGVKINELWKGSDDYLAIVDSQSTIEKLEPNFRDIATLDSRGIIVSSIGEEVDFVSRGFFPQTGVDEDPATGSAHTMLTPYWFPRIKKNRLNALQLSKRVGQFECIYKGDRTAIIGNAVSYMNGVITV